MPFSEGQLSPTKLAIASFKKLFNYLRASPILFGKVHGSTTGKKNDIRLGLDKKALENFRLARKWRRLQKEDGK